MSVYGVFQNISLTPWLWNIRARAKLFAWQVGRENNAVRFRNNVGDQLEKIRFPTYRTWHRKCLNGPNDILSEKFTAIFW